jgi:hypothetical protein
MHIKSEKTVITLANAITLASAILSEVAGNEVSDTLEGEVVKKAAMHDLVASHMAANFSKYLVKGVQ